MKKFKSVWGSLFVLIMFCMIISCAGRDITPVGQASVMSKTVSQTYITLHETYINLSGVLVGDDLEKLKEAAPILDKAKKHLIAYNDLIISWVESGGAQPAELITNEKLLNSLLAEISAILIEFI